MNVKDWTLDSNTYLKHTEIYETSAPLLYGSFLRIKHPPISAEEPEYKADCRITPPKGTGLVLS